MKESEIAIENLTKNFEDVIAVDGISLKIEKARALGFAFFKHGQYASFKIVHFKL